MQVQNKVIGVLAKSLFLLLNKSRRVYEGDEAMLTKSFIEFYMMQRISSAGMSISAPAALLSLTNRRTR